MKKLNIHRDTPEPSVKDMERHMNFEEVLHRASNSTTTSSKGINKSWLIGGTTVITAIITSVILFTRINNPTKTNYKNLTMEGEAIERITSIISVNEGADFQMTTPIETYPEIENIEKQASIDTIPQELEPPKIAYYEPRLVGSIPFVFDESFGLKEQWQEFPELSIYEKLVFQPVDKLQNSLLKVHWEKVKFSKDESGQYYLTLFKGDQAVFCAVAPVFEKEDFVEALQVYQENQ